MPSCCVVNGCKSSSNLNKENRSKHIKFFHFPKNCDVRKQWIEACANKKVNTTSGRICSLHFTDDDWRLKDILLNTPIEKRLLKPTAVPSVMIVKKPKPPSTIARERRIAQRERKRIVESAITNYENSILAAKNVPVVPNAQKDKKKDVSNVSEKENNPVSCSLEQTTNNSVTIIQVQEEPPTAVKSIAVQTEVEINCAREFKIMELEKTIKLLNKKMQNMEKALGKIFTEGQIKKMKNPGCKLFMRVRKINKERNKKKKDENEAN